MNLLKLTPRSIIGLIWAAVGCLIMRPGPASGALEETFDVLQIGTHTFQNVTVTTKSKNYIFIMHSAGMTNIKVKDLPAGLRTQLGYTDVAETSVSSWATHGMSQMHPAELKQLERKIRAYAPASIAYATFTPNLIFAVCSVLVLLYLLICYCGMLICTKTGNAPGVMVWIPVLQLIPLIRAAGMSPAWFLAFFVPVLNIVAQIVWSLNIAKARGKSGWVAFFLVLPLTSLFAYLYLALSDRPPRKQERAVEIMTLEAA
jgi:hypothetical protein